MIYWIPFAQETCYESLSIIVSAASDEEAVAKLRQKMDASEDNWLRILGSKMDLEEVVREAKKFEWFDDICECWMTFR